MYLFTIGHKIKGMPRGQLWEECLISHKCVASSVKEALQQAKYKEAVLTGRKSNELNHLEFYVIRKEKQ